jgi:hypothetical protein
VRRGRRLPGRRVVPSCPHTLHLHYNRIADNG